MCAWSRLSGVIRRLLMPLDTTFPAPLLTCPSLFTSSLPSSAHSAAFSSFTCPSSRLPLHHLPLPLTCSFSHLHSAPHLPLSSPAPSPHIHLLVPHLAPPPHLRHLPLSCCANFRLILQHGIFCQEWVLAARLHESCGICKPNHVCAHCKIAVTLKAEPVLCVGDYTFSNNVLLVSIKLGR